MTTKLRWLGWSLGVLGWVLLGGLVAVLELSDWEGRSLRIQPWQEVGTSWGPGVIVLAPLEPTAAPSGWSRILTVVERDGERSDVRLGVFTGDRAGLGHMQHTNLNDCSQPYGSLELQELGLFIRAR